MPPWACQTGPGVASKWIVAALRRDRWIEEEAPSAAWIGAGARPGRPVAAEIKACPLREEAVAAAVGAEVAAVVVAVGAEEAAAVVVAAVGAEVVAAAADEGNLPGTTHPLSKGGKSHGAIHQ
jgi:hypothetical protein